MADEHRELRTLRTIDLTAETWPVVAALECGHFKTFGYADSPTLLTVVECAECRPMHAIVSSELPSHAFQYDGAGRGACGTWEGAPVGAGVPRRVVRAVSVAALVRIVDGSMAAPAFDANDARTWDGNQNAVYETGYREGGENAHVGWLVEIAEVVDDVKTPVELREVLQRVMGSARLLVAAADRLAAAVAHRIEVGHLDARSEAGDALLDYDTLDEHRAALGLEPREGRIGG